MSIQIDQEYDFISLNKREFMQAAWSHNDRVAAIHHLIGGIHEFIAEDGSVMGHWDDISEFGVLASEFTWCPIGAELDTQLIKAAAPLLGCQVSS